MEVTKLLAKVSHAQLSSFVATHAQMSDNHSELNKVATICIGHEVIN